MEIRELTTFLQVAKLQSFSKAAEKLGYSQAAVTIQIKQLEKELEIRLFDRMGKKIFLTDEGHIFYEYASKILHDVTEAKERLSQKTVLNGRLRIGTIESICASVFPGLLTTFHELYPEVTTNIVIESPGALLDMLNQNVVDIVYLLDKRMYDPGLIKVMEEADEVIFVAASDYPLPETKPMALDRLLQEPFILTEHNASYRFILEQYLAAQQKEVFPFLSIGNTEFIIRMIEKGLGVSFLPHFVVQPHITSGALKVIEVDNFYMRVWRQIFYHKDKWVTGEMKAFVELANLN